MRTPMEDRIIEILRTEPQVTSLLIHKKFPKSRIDTIQRILYRMHRGGEIRMTAKLTAFGKRYNVYEGVREYSGGYGDSYIRDMRSEWPPRMLVRSQEVIK